MASDAVTPSPGRRPRSGLLLAVLDGIAEGVVVSDPGGRVVLANRAARQMLGEVPDGLEPSGWAHAFGLYSPGSDDHAPVGELPLERALRGQPAPPIEVFIRNPLRPGGGWLELSGVPLGNGHGGGAAVVIRDVTAGRQRDELSRRLASAIEQTADGVFITDRDGVIEYVNPAFEQITGFSRQEAVGQTPRLLRSGNQGPEYYARLWSTILAGRVFKGTTVNRTKGGELFWAEQTITPMTDGSSRRVSHFVSVLRDMTERMRLEERELEMRLAAAVQRRLFPSRAPRVPGYDLAGTSAPALATGGDYFDFLPRPDGSLALVVADVCGHGVGPALIMAETRACLQALARAGKSVEEILREVNTTLLADLDDDLFVTLLLVVLDPASGSVTWASAGHPSAFVVDAEGRVLTELSSTGRPLGLFPSTRPATSRAAALAPGDLLLLLTDGLAETTSPDGRDLGAAAVLDVVRAHRAQPAQVIVERVLAAAAAFRCQQPQEDDLTLVVCRRLPAGATTGGETGP